MKYADKIKFLTAAFGESKLQNDGVELTVRCPKCGKPGKKKMCIRLDSDLFHCWVCNLSGKNVSKLVRMKKPCMASEYLHRFRPNALLYDNSLSISEFEPATLPEGFNLVMESLRDPDALAVRNYAHSRGITDRMLWRYRVGYSDEWKLRRRLIIPSFDVSGDLNYWAARAIDDDSYMKYVNATAPKAAIIFNEIDLDFTKPVCIVEGPLDLVKCINLNSTCLLGSSLAENSLLFYELASNDCHVILCLDPDARKKQDKIADLLTSYNLSVSSVVLSKGDVGDLDPQEIEQLASQAVQWNKNSNLLNRIEEL